MLSRCRLARKRKSGCRTGVDEWEMGKGRGGGLNRKEEARPCGKVS